MAMRERSPPCRRVAVEQRRLALERHGVDDETSAGPERRDGGVEDGGVACAAADEDRVGRVEAGEGCRRAAFDDGEAGNAEGGGVPGDARGALGVGLDGDGARASGSASIHSIADRAGAGADVPEQLAAARRERRQRDGADLALGELAVVLEQAVRQAGDERDDACARSGVDLERDGVEGVDAGEVEACGLRRADALARAAERLQHRQPRRAEARVGDETGEGGRVRRRPR